MAARPTDKYSSSGRSDPPFPLRGALTVVGSPVSDVRAPRNVFGNARSMPVNDMTARKLKAHNPVARCNSKWKRRFGAFLRTDIHAPHLRGPVSHINILLILREKRIMPANPTAF